MDKLISIVLNNLLKLLCIARNEVESYQFIIIIMLKINNINRKYIYLLSYIIYIVWNSHNEEMGNVLIFKL